MMNGKCRVWRDGEKLCAEMELPTPTGPVVWNEEVEAPVDDETAEKRIKAKVHSVAGFFPTEEMVGVEVLGAAVELYGQWMDPESRPEADARIDLMREQAEAGNERAEDLGYALNRVIRSRSEVLGAFSFKKLRKFAKRNVKYALPVVGLPMAAIALARAARGGNRAAVRKVEALQAIAETNPAALPARDASGNPAPVEAVQAMQAQAQQAVANVQAAAQAQDGYSPDFSARDADEEEGYPEDVNEGEEEGETEAVQGGDDDEIGGGDDEEIGLSCYQRGATANQMAGEIEEEEMAGLFDLVKKIGRVIDPMKKGSLLNQAVAAIPGVGPTLQSSMNLISAAKGGNAAAVEKIQTIKDLANAGVPKANEAMANLKTGQGLLNRMSGEVASFMKPGGWWLTRTYRSGAAGAY